MDMSNSVVESIQRLIIKAKATPEVLDQIMVEFSNAIALGDLSILNSLQNPLIELCDDIIHNNSKEYKAFIQGTLTYYTSKCSESEEYLLSINPSECKWNNPEFAGVVEVITGANYRSLGELEKATVHLHQALKIISSNGPLSVFALMGNYHMGEIYHTLKEYDNSEKSFMAGLSIANGGNASAGIFRISSGLANLYISQSKLDNCFEQLKTAQEYAFSNSQKARNHYDWAVYYLNKEQLTEALSEAKESYEIRLNSGLPDAANTSLILIARIHSTKEEWELVIDLLNNGLKSKEEYNSPIKTQEIYLLLSKAYEKSGMWEMAYQSYKAFEEIKSNLLTEQRREIIRRQNEAMEKQKVLIEHAHQEIKDSITYAKRIQQAILPPKGRLSELYPESFILYKPKDIVAGDFYWVEHLNNSIWIAAADCTGHGVPGAMVSVICNNALNRSLREYRITEPGKILDKVRELVIEEFEKSEEEVKDGMDIALCRIEQNVLTYSGANNPLWLIRNGEIIEYKADKQPVGKYEHLSPFNSHQIELQKGDTFYIFSDGYVDQFGGEKGKKFKPSNLRKLLLSIQDKPLSEQKIILNDSFESWKGNQEQIDDVCMIGVRID